MEELRKILLKAREKENKLTIEMVEVKPNYFEKKVNR